MEMSRQRIRTGVLESSTVPCPHCRGTGQVRSVSSLSLQILRALEDHLLRHSGHHLLVRTREEVALYVLNQKRRHLSDLEARFGVQIAISGEAPENGAGYSIERGAPVEDRPEATGAIAMRDMPEAAVEEEPEDEVEQEASRSEREVEAGGGEGRERRPRRRRRRRGNGDDRHEHRHAEAAADEDGERGSRARRRTSIGRSVRAEATESAESREAPPSSAAVAAVVGAAVAARTASAARTARAAEAACRAEGECARANRRDADDADRDAGRPMPFAEAPLVAADFRHAEEACALGRSSSREAGASPSRWKSARTPEPETKAEPAAEAEPGRAESSPATDAAEPEPDDDRPKRSGWWNRRSSFF